MPKRILDAIARASNKRFKEKREKRAAEEAAKKKKKVARKVRPTEGIRRAIKHRDAGLAIQPRDSLNPKKATKRRMKSVDDPDK